MHDTTESPEIISVIQVFVFRFFCNFILSERSLLPAILFLSAVTTSVEHVTRTVKDEEMAVFGMNAM